MSTHVCTHTLLSNNLKKEKKEKDPNGQQKTMFHYGVSPVPASEYKVIRALALEKNQQGHKLALRNRLEKVSQVRTVEYGSLQRGEKKEGLQVWPSARSNVPGKMEMVKPGGH